ncbi:DUF1896 family protein [Pelobium manganitolerans]|uniref:DUF1896 family protein n=1 Tax=Pelobium manganitolerans TaxID=1842495 RepID=UPI003FA3BA3F
MQSILKTRLHGYLCESHPDLLIHLEETFSLNKYLEEKIAAIGLFLQKLIESGKPSYIIKELCMKRLTEDLKPSKFLYLKSLLEEEFMGDYLMMEENGTLTFEAVNIIGKADHIFQQYPLLDSAKNQTELRLALIAFVNDYLINN